MTGKVPPAAWSSWGRLGAARLRIARSPAGRGSAAPRTTTPRRPRPPRSRRPSPTAAPRPSTASACTTHASSPLFTFPRNGRQTRKRSCLVGLWFFTRHCQIHTWQTNAWSVRQRNNKYYTITKKINNFIFCLSFVKLTQQIAFTILSFVRLFIYTYRKH